MKNIGVLLTALLLVGCSIPKNPKVSFGKKCTVQDDQIVWSYAWLYNKNTGLEANKENCKLIKD